MPSVDVYRLTVPDDQAQAAQRAVELNGLTAQIVFDGGEGRPVAFEIWGVNPVNAPGGLRKARRQTAAALRWIAYKHEGSLTRQRATVLHHYGMNPPSLPPHPLQLRRDTA